MVRLMCSPLLGSQSQRRVQVTSPFLAVNWIEKREVLAPHLLWAYRVQDNATALKFSSSSSLKDIQGTHSCGKRIVQTSQARRDEVHNLGAYEV